MKYDRLKELRMKANKTQTQMGEILGVNQRSYSNYEVGIRNISVELLAMLADYYDVSVDYIIGRTDNPKLAK